MAARLRVRRSWLGPAVIGGVALAMAGGGAIASLETGTVSSFGRGLWWAVSLMTTVGFVGSPPTTTAGVLVSVVLMVAGFMLLALVSAALASLFVEDDIAPFEAGEHSADAEILRRLGALQEQVADLERRLAAAGGGDPDAPC